MIVFRIKAHNFDRRAEAQARAIATEKMIATGRRHVVEYQDDYNDHNVSGMYVVRATA